MFLQNFHNNLKIFSEILQIFLVFHIFVKRFYIFSKFLHDFQKFIKISPLPRLYSKFAQNFPNNILQFFFFQKFVQNVRNITLRFIRRDLKSMKCAIRFLEGPTM